MADKVLSEIPNSVAPNLKPLAKYLADIKREDYVERLTETYYEFAKTSGVSIIDKYFDTDITKFDEEANVIFEGAQGVLLDNEKGFFPYVTSGSTTFENAENLLLSSGFCGEIVKIGVLRPYFTRHGEGPFVTEDSELAALLPEIHNKENEWQGKMRIGWFDFVAAEYALKVAGKIDYLAITNIDRLTELSEIKFCHSYEYEGTVTKSDEFSLFNWGVWDGKTFITGIKSNFEPELIRNGRLAEHLKKCKPSYRSYSFYNEGKETAIKNFIKYIEGELKTPLGITSYGPTASDKVCWMK